MGFWSKKNKHQLRFAVDYAELSPCGVFKLSGWRFPYDDSLSIIVDGVSHSCGLQRGPRPDVAEHLIDQISVDVNGDFNLGFLLLLPKYLASTSIALFSGSDEIYSHTGQCSLSKEQKQHFNDYLSAYLKLQGLDEITIGKTIIIRESFEHKEDEHKGDVLLSDGILSFCFDHLSLLKELFQDKKIHVADTFSPKIKRSLDYVFDIKKTEKFKKPSEHITLIIPVFNALDATSRCLKSLIKIEGFTEFKVIIVDDCSDSYTAKYLENFASKFENITYKKQEKNGGFLKTCKAGLELAHAESDIILINSDVVLTKQALKLLIKGAHSRPNIAAASCMSTNSPNCQLELPSGFSLEQVAEYLEKNYRAKYPTLITPEGQCLYIKRWAIEKFGFFDPIFEEGFGEESDLCMRFYCGGADTICVDNALILHRKSASFGLERGEQLKSKHWPIFSERWGVAHRIMHTEFLRRNPFAEIRAKLLALSNQEIYPQNELRFPQTKPNVVKRSQQKALSLLGDAEVIFLLPNTYVGGGTLSVLQHVNEMIERDVKARIISLWQPYHTNFHALASVLPVSVENVFELDWNEQKVIATFWTTAYVLSELCSQNKGLKPFYYVQGYEPDFYSKDQETSIKQASESYYLGHTTVVKSQYLKNTLFNSQGIEAKKISAGIVRTVFYPGEQNHHTGATRITAYYRPGTPDRGAKKVEQVLSQLLEKHPELEVSLFGENDCKSELLGEKVSYLGMLSQEQVAKQYRKSDLVFDFAEFHGFGRVGIEGMCCGAVPVLTPSGGIDEYAINQKNSFIAEQNPELISVTSRLIEDNTLRLAMRDAAIKTAEGFSEQQATSDWLKIIED